MTASRAVVLVALIVVGLALAPAGAALDGATDDGGDEGTNETSMGAEVNTFMHSNTAGVDDAVEAGMFDASYERAAPDERAAVVSDRTRTLEAKLDALEAERAALEEREGDLPQPAYDARMTRLAVEISALERALNDTETRAVESGADPTEIRTLRGNVAELSGPEVAAVAKGIAGVEPPRGPPDDTPGAGAGTPDGPQKDDANGDGDAPNDDD
ncbi:ABC transporter C-terminal domain-containing protein [Salinilacihabitans rarus]|uniref:ABC transporter C-terminal domain-containing protein n=1 Tax=Salinilacihabitans rarus TaxID=2961596 RepID=UPI0020C8C510|nr:ABC transporter C-terminal domain-containing protein [Salinilacihabitans rarus]